MRGIVSTLAVASILIGGAAAAQTGSVSSLPAADSSLTATFYDDNPFTGGEMLEGDLYGSVVKASLSPGSLGNVVDNSDEADFVLLQVAGGGDGLAFELRGGSSPNTLSFNGVNGDTTLKLSEVVGDINAALSGETNLAVFMDGDGVVTGFYTFGGGVMPNINVDEATHVALVWNGQIDVLETLSDPGARPLRTVQVVQDGTSASLSDLTRLNN